MNHKSISAATLLQYICQLTLLGSIGASIVLWKGGSNLMVGTLTYGTLAAFITYALQFLSY